MSEHLSQQQADLFAGHAPTWWAEDGAFAPLHRITPTRMTFIRDHLCAHFGRDPKMAKPLAGLTAIDIGCGGGLICEPLARLGAQVTGIDAVAANIAAAQAHADEAGLEIAYEVAAPEEIAAKGSTFDIVINLEVIEHVSDPESFMAAAICLAALATPPYWLNQGNVMVNGCVMLTIAEATDPPIYWAKRSPRNACASSRGFFT